MKKSPPQGQLEIVKHWKLQVYTDDSGYWTENLGGIVFKSNHSTDSNGCNFSHNTWGFWRWQPEKLRCYITVNNSFQYWRITVCANLWHQGLQPKPGLRQTAGLLEMIPVETLTKAFTPGINMRLGWADHKWTALSTGVNATQDALRTHWDPTAQTTFVVGLGRIYPYSLSSVNANVILATLKARLPNWRALWKQTLKTFMLLSFKWKWCTCLFAYRAGGEWDPISETRVEPHFNSKCELMYLELSVRDRISKTTC